MINRMRLAIRLALLGLTVIAVVAGCGGTAPNEGDEAAQELALDVEGTIAEWQIVGRLAAFAGEECLGMDALDSGRVTPDLQITFSPWELSAVRMGGESEVAAVKDRFKYSKITIDADSSEWTVYEHLAGKREEMEAKATGVVRLQDSLGNKYLRVHNERETASSNLGMLLSADSSVSIVTSPVEVNITMPGEVERHYECGRYVGYFHATGAEVVQDSIVKVGDGEDDRDR